jgi:molecular chaperone GrpE (heat shock protein)
LNDLHEAGLGAGNRQAHAADPSTVHGPFERTCLGILEQLAANQTALGQQFADLAGQNAFLREQIGTLYGAVRAQCTQSRDSDAALQSELRKFQTGGPQRAMAAIVHKLFRELLGHMAQLDELVALGGQAEPHAAAQPWIDALRIGRDRFEQILKEWGCTPVVVRVGEEEFDPENHEAVPSDPGEIPDGTPEHIIVRVHRRGWKLHDHILVHPQVVVS